MNRFIRGLGWMILAVAICSLVAVTPKEFHHALSVVAALPILLGVFTWTGRI